MIYLRIAQSALSITLQNTYLHLKVNNLIELFIVKLEQIFVFGNNLDLLKSSYIPMYELEMAKLGPARGPKRAGPGRAGPGSGLKIQARGPYGPKRA